MSNYYIRRNTPKEVVSREAPDAEPVTISEHERLDLFVCRNPDGLGYRVHEGRIGTQLGQGLTIKAAVLEATERLGQYGPDTLDMIIELTAGRHESPRYKGDK